MPMEERGGAASSLEQCGQPLCQHGRNIRFSFQHTHASTDLAVNAHSPFSCLYYVHILSIIYVCMYYILQLSIGVYMCVTQVSQCP